MDSQLVTSTHDSARARSPPAPNEENLRAAPKGLLASSRRRSVGAIQHAGEHRMRRAFAVMLALSLVSAAAADAQSAGAKPKPKRPDLVVTFVGSPPANATPGTAFASSATVRNRGKATAARSTTRFFLSSDAKVSRGDLRLGDVAVPRLRATRQSTRRAQLRIPAFTHDGTYRLIACANRPNRFKESSQRNNCRVARRAVKVAKGSGPRQRAASLKRARWAQHLTRDAGVRLGRRRREERGGRLHRHQHRVLVHRHAGDEHGRRGRRTVHADSGQLRGCIALGWGNLLDHGRVRPDEHGRQGRHASGLRCTGGHRRLPAERHRRHACRARDLPRHPPVRDGRGG